MKSFNYTITDEVGIHARPAGMLVKEAGKFKSLITVTNMSNGKVSEANKLFGIMGLAVKCGNNVKVTIEGEDENSAYEKLLIFFKEQL